MKNTKKIFLKNSVVVGLLAFCKGTHPDEGILVLRGKSNKESIMITDLILPPLATRSEDFASFSPYLLPLDLSMQGVAHSHPNGVLMPSQEDLNNFFGRIMIIVGPPYNSRDNIRVFDRDGNRVNFQVLENEE